jgi:hypothetical protein
MNEAEAEMLAQVTSKRGEHFDTIFAQHKDIKFASIIKKVCYDQ